MTIGYILEINKCLSSQIRLIVISLNGSHAIFIKSHHSLWQISRVTRWIILKFGIVLEEVLKVLILFSRADARIDVVIL
jgi:hypothetical protein